MRVLVVTPEYHGIGGIQTCLRNWIRGLETLEFDVSVLYIEPGDDHRRPTDLLGLVGEGVYQRTVRRVVDREIRRIEPDLIHVGHVDAWPALEVAEDHDVASILSVYAWDLASDSARPAVEAADRVIAISDYTADLALEVGAFPVDIVTPSIDVDSYSRSAEDSPGGPVVSIARHVERKQLPLLIHAWRLLETDRRLIIGGSGPETERLRSIAGPNVELVGLIEGSEKRQLLREASVFALAPATVGSDVEGFGIVYIEAQAAGTPVVASASGGAPYAVGGGGVVVPDEAERVASAITQLLKSSASRSAVLGAIERRIDRFDLVPVAEDLAESYRKEVPQ